MRIRLLFFIRPVLTGRPKGVMLTHKNVAAIADIWSESMEMDDSDRVHIVAPLFHCAASHVFSIPVIYRGGMVIIEEAFSPESTIRTMEAERASIFFGVPADVQHTAQYTGT